MTRPGRPSVLTEDVLAQIAELRGEGLGRELAELRFLLRHGLFLPGQGYAIAILNEKPGRIVRFLSLSGFSIAMQLADGGEFGIVAVLEAQEIAYTEGFREKVKSVVREIGANRESELVTVALLVAEMAGVNVLKELESANELREMEIFAASDSDLDELRAIVLELSAGAQEKLLDGAPETRLIQAKIRREFNRRKKEDGGRQIHDRRFARLRRDLGVKDEWLVKGAETGGLVWRLPLPWLSSLSRLSSTHMGRTEPTEPTEAKGGDLPYAYDEDSGPVHADPRKQAALERLRGVLKNDGEGSS